MNFRVLLVALLFVTLQAQAGDPQQLDRSITDKYVGKALTVRGFYTQNNLEYDSAGEPKFKGEPGPWTLYGRVEVTALKVRKGKLEVEGNRVWVKWAADSKGDRQMRMLRTQEPVVIRVDLLSPADPAEVDKLMLKIFLTRNDRMSDLVPPLWRQFLAGPPASAIGGAAASKPKPGEPPVPRAPMKGVTEGRLRKRVYPEYSKQARSVRLEGALVFDAVIDKQGRLRDVSVEQPLGLGMEESAAEALNQWVYQPYLVNGQAVEVPTRITLNFSAR